MKVAGVVQEGFYSCWSTSAQMIIGYRGKVARQCEQANLAFPPPPIQCCDPNGELSYNANCDKASLPRFDQWLSSSAIQRVSKPLTWSEITTEIDAGRPFCFSWIPNPATGNGNQNLNTIGHMMVITGYDPTTFYVKVLDPRWRTSVGESWVPFSDYYGNTGPNIHQYDYYMIQ